MIASVIGVGITACGFVLFVQGLDRHLSGKRAGWRAVAGFTLLTMGLTTLSFTLSSALPC